MLVECLLVLDKVLNSEQLMKTWVLVHRGGLHLHSDHEEDTREQVRWEQSVKTPHCGRARLGAG